MSAPPRVPPVPAVLRLVQMMVLGRWRATGEELYREVLEVLNASRDARSKADHDEAKAKLDVEAQAGRLETAQKRVTDLRATLWAPKDKVRVADSDAEMPATD